MPISGDDLVAGWMVAHPFIARGRLLTASRHMTNVDRQLNQLIGYLDSDKAESKYLELGITKIHSGLLHVVTALDMVKL